MVTDIDEALQLARDIGGAHVTADGAVLSANAGYLGTSHEAIDTLARAVLEMHAEIERMRALDPNDDSLSDADHYRAHVMRQAQALCSLNRDRDRLREALREALDIAANYETGCTIFGDDPDYERMAALRKEFGL